ncbi:PX domain-containing protein 1-like [Notolabrus celidotus]|uniref:PX domain-containing protein 1-like n=1 Tax=Notolabrus celidotus TaxID=1203425 RepID=UPI0014900C47|nr:PX domain-containing protein 1-like [Notolabrus celidotus]
MSSGVHVTQVWVELLSAGQVEVRAGLSYGSFLLLHRTDEDLARMMKRLVNSFHDDRETLSSSLLTVTPPPQSIIHEDQKVDQSIIHEDQKIDQSSIHEDQKVDQSIIFEDQKIDQSNRHAVQDDDQSIIHEDQDDDQSIIHEDQDEDLSSGHEDQDLRDFQSTGSLSEISRSNGFCLANTETILFDPTPPTNCVNQSEDSTVRR